MQSGKQVFICPKCNCDKYSSKSSFIDHLLSHVDLTLFSCPSCNFSGAARRSIIGHVKLKHITYEREFAEALRDKTEDAKKKLSEFFPTLFGKHNRFVNPGKSCRNSTGNKQLTNGEILFQCQETNCQAQYKTKMSFYFHRLLHVNSDIFSCLWCPRKCSKSDLIIRHVKNCNPAGIEQFKKQLAAKIKQARSQLAKGSHYQSTASGEVGYASSQEDELFDIETICSGCTKKFSSIELLKSHKETVHKKMCTMCPAVYYSDASFLDHLLIHLQASLFDCTECKQPYKSSKRSLEHLKKKHPANANQLQDQLLTRMKKGLDQLKQSKDDFIRYLESFMPTLFGSDLNENALNAYSNTQDESLGFDQSFEQTREEFVHVQELRFSTLLDIDCANLVTQQDIEQSWLEQLSIDQVKPSSPKRLRDNDYQTNEWTNKVAKVAE